MDELLVKYLLGETTKEEEEVALNWINASAEHRKHFDQLEWVWKESKALENQYQPDENEVWERFQASIADASEQNQKTSLPFVKRSRWRMVAAAAVILIIGGLAFSLFSNREVIIASHDQVLTATLPDHSVVTLNKNSTLAYTKAFNQKDRRVRLSGEAFFQVTHNTEKPFLIKAGQVSVKVVGTSFNVKQTRAQTEIIVETGIVRVEKNKNAIRLLPHQKAVVFRDKDKPEVKPIHDKLYNYYRTREFVCDGTPLWKLVDVLNEAYDVHIVIANDSIRNLPLTTTFKDASLPDILAVLTQTLDIREAQQGTRIILK